MFTGAVDSLGYCSEADCVLWFEQVREYEPFIVVETDCDSVAGSKGFNTVAGYVALSAHFNLARSCECFFFLLSGVVSKLEYNITVLFRVSRNHLQKYTSILNRDSNLSTKVCACVSRYIFGKNEKGEKMKMTTPVYTETSSEPTAPGAKIQIVLPLSSKFSE